MLTFEKPIPGYQVSVVRLSCSACGAEANASCDCGQPYVPVKERVAEYDKANPGQSTRAAAADLGVSKSEVNRARQSGVPYGTGEQSGEHQYSPETVTGRDGKQYPAKAERSQASKPYVDPNYLLAPIQHDLLAQAKLPVELMNGPTRFKFLEWLNANYDREFRNGSSR